MTETRCWDWPMRPCAPAIFPRRPRYTVRLTAANANDESSWLGLIQAQVGGERSESCHLDIAAIPPAVKQRMEARSDYLSEMALVYYEANHSRRRRSIAAQGDGGREELRYGRRTQPFVFKSPVHLWIKANQDVPSRSTAGNAVAS